MNSASCIKSNLILDVLHNLHIIRNDLQSEKTYPTEILTRVLLTRHPQMNFSTTDSSTFSISVQIILVKPMCLRQITAAHPQMKLDFIACVRSSLYHTCIKSAAQVLHSQYLTSWHTNEETGSITSVGSHYSSVVGECYVWQWLVSCPINNGNDSIRGALWDVIQRSAKCKWQGHPKWQ